jgi:hypothetical protein
MKNIRTTYARAKSYDPEFERALADEIEQVILNASRITDADILARRTGETISALVNNLAQVIALTPCAMRSPTKFRKLIDTIAKRLRRQAAEIAADPNVQNFHKRAFHSTHVEGNA